MDLKDMTTAQIWERLQSLSIRLTECKDEWNAEDEGSGQRNNILSECTNIMQEADDLQAEMYDRREDTPDSSLNYEETDSGKESTFGPLYRGFNLKDDDPLKPYSGDQSKDCGARALSALTGIEYSIALRDLNEANAAFGDTSVSMGGSNNLAMQKVYTKYGLDLRTPLPACNVPMHDAADSGVLSPKQAHDIYGNAILLTGDDPGKSNIGDVNTEHAQAVVDGTVKDTWDSREERSVVGIYTPTKGTPKAVKEARKEIKKSSPNLDYIKSAIIESQKTPISQDPSELANTEADRAQLAAYIDTLYPDRDKRGNVMRDVIQHTYNTSNRERATIFEEASSNIPTVRQRRQQHGVSRPRGKLFWR